MLELWLLLSWGYSIRTRLLESLLSKWIRETTSWHASKHSHSSHHRIHSTPAVHILLVIICTRRRCLLKLFYFCIQFSILLTQNINFGLKIFLELFQLFNHVVSLCDLFHSLLESTLIGFLNFLKLSLNLFQSEFLAVSWLIFTLNLDYLLFQRFDLIS